MMGFWRSVWPVRTAALAVTLLATAPASAQLAEGQVFGDWVVHCATPPGATHHVCSLNQGVFSKEPRRKLLNVAVAFVGKNRTPSAFFLVPLRVYLPAGLTLSVPGAQVARIVYDICLPQGCRAPVALTKELIAAMKRAGRGEITVQNERRKPVKLPLSLKGFTAGYEALSKQ